MANYKAVFIGTGMIGAGLGANALLHDFDVTLYDVVSEEQIRKNLKNIFLYPLGFRQRFVLSPFWSFYLFQGNRNL